MSGTQVPYVMPVKMRKFIITLLAFAAFVPATAAEEETQLPRGALELAPGHVAIEIKKSSYEHRPMRGTYAQLLKCVDVGKCTLLVKCGRVLWVSPEPSPAFFVEGTSEELTKVEEATRHGAVPGVLLVNCHME